MESERATTFSAPTADDPALAEIVRRLVEVYRPERIYLFGSVARGDAGADSDYDPLANFSWVAPVDWNVSVKITEMPSGSGAQVGFEVTGSVTCFPSHETWLDYNRLWLWWPAGPSTLPGCLPGALPRIQISQTGQLYYP